MTAVTRAKEVLEGLAGKVLANAKMITHVENYTGMIGGGLTNEQKAQEFLDIMLREAKIRIRTNARNIKLTVDKPAANQAGDDAIVDL